MKSLFVFFLIGIFSVSIIAQPNQDHNLAIQYYKNGDFEKAAGLFEQLYEENEGSLYYYRYLYNSLLQLQEYRAIEKLIKKQSRKDKNNPTYSVDLGFLYSQQGKLEDAQKAYDEAVNDLGGSSSQVMQLANAFINIREYEFAVKAYERGKILMDNNYYMELANLYRQINEDERMVENYLKYLTEQPGQLELVMTRMVDKIEEDEFYGKLQSKLYGMVQSNANEIIFNEALIWLFMQKNDYESAFTQVKALDRRFKEDGKRIYDLGSHALSEGHYNAAINAYQYVVDKGKENRYYVLARQMLLEAKNEKILSQYDYTEENLISLKTEYKSFLNEFGHNRQMASKTLKALARLEAYYFHDLEEAIRILEDLLQTSGLREQFIATSKLDLGDYYLMKGEIWEATLLYSQVDKKMKDDPLGEEARFKNAKLAYYNGDFEWAQAQMDVLKASTSELISNDAIDLSVFITKHLGLDTTTVPMWMFARADLLTFQNKDEQALLVMDSINEMFPSHSLNDDMLFLKAEIKLKKNKPEEAIVFLEELKEKYPDELLSDDALFLLAMLYEERLQNTEQAMEYYQQIILNYKGSIYVVEARERFRKLRGDKLN